MQRLLRPLTSAVSRHPAITIVLVLVLTAVISSFASQQTLSNDSEAFSPRTDEIIASEVLAERFDDSGTAPFQVVVRGDDVISAAGARTQLGITRAAMEAFGPALASEGDGPPVFGYLTPALFAAQQQGVDLATADDATVDMLQRAALEGPPPGAPVGGEAEGAAGGNEGPDPAAGLGFAAQLSSGDDPTSATAGLLLFQIDIAAYPDEAALNAAQVAFAETLDATDLPLEVFPFSFALASDPGDDFQQEVGRLFVTAALVILFVLAFVMRARRGQHLGALAAVRRSVADMAMSLFAVFTGIGLLQGLAVLLGPNYLGIVNEATPPTQIVPILLLALGVSYTIYVQSRYREELNDGEPEPGAVVARLGPTIGVALLLSMVTTAIGFLTNVTSPIPAIRDLGVLAAVGILVVFFLTLTLLPAIRLLLDQRAARRGALARDEVRPSERSPFARLALLAWTPATKAPVASLAVVGLLAAGGAYGLSQIDAEFDFTAFLPEDSPLVTAVDVLDAEFGGGLAEITEVLVEGDAVTGDDFDAAVAQVRADLGGVDGVVTVGGTADVTVAVDDGDEAVARLAFRSQSERVGVEAFTDDVEAALAPVEQLGLETVVVNDAIVIDGILTGLTSSQATGLMVTLGAVLALLMLVYGVRLGDPVLGVAVTTPVGVVVLWVFGVMWLTGIPFDPITAIISALVIGVGIDFSIHLGERFVEDLRLAGGDVEEALRASLKHTGAALVGSAATTVLGFSALLFASIVPFQRMGTVTIYAVGLSLLSALFVLPPLLVLYGRWRGDRVGAASGSTTVARQQLEPA